MAVKQNLDGMTKALARAVSGATGYLVQTAANTFALRTFTQSTGITLTNPAGTAGATNIAPGALLAALQTLGTAGTAGLVAVTGTNTAAVRTLTGTGLAVASNGSGAAGAPDIAVTAATQSDQETASSTTTVVTPARQHNHPSAAKCWAYVTVSAGTPTLAANYNITSISDGGVGQLTITIATDFSSASWAGFAMAEETGGGAIERHIYSTGRAAGSIDLVWTNGTPAVADPDHWNFVGFGDQ